MTVHGETTDSNEAASRRPPLARLYSSAKKTKPTDVPSSSHFPPEFWDNLSHIWFTPRALRELDGQNSSRPAPKPTISDISFKDLPQLARDGGEDLVRFARHGGPNLCDLRGYPYPVTNAMAPGHASGPPETEQTPPTELKSASSKLKPSSAYDQNFEQHLIDHKMYPPLHKSHYKMKPANLEETRQFLRTHRSSLSSQVFTESDFEDFALMHVTPSEGTLMRTAIPIIAGNANIPNEGHLPFTNLEMVTNGRIAPDFFDGAPSEAVDRQVREDLNQKIVPTEYPQVPVMPNLSLEVKGPSGNARVAQRQACHNGAYAARGMHSLQNYGEEEPVYDGNSYAYSSTYYDGTLKLYAHHPTTPSTAGGEPKYHMTPIKHFAITSDRESCVAGIRAFRNLRDRANDYRTQFIQEANTKARGPTNAEALAAQGGHSNPAGHVVEAEGLREPPTDGHSPG